MATIKDLMERVMNNDGAFYSDVFIQNIDAYRVFDYHKRLMNADLFIQKEGETYNVIKDRYGKADPEYTEEELAKFLLENTGS